VAPANWTERSYDLLRRKNRGTAGGFHYFSCFASITKFVATGEARSDSEHTGLSTYHTIERSSQATSLHQLASSEIPAISVIKCKPLPFTIAGDRPAAGYFLTSLMLQSYVRAETQLLQSIVYLRRQENASFGAAKK
jgi:hypothetical protein